MPITPTRPTNIVVPFARTGVKNTIPVATASPLASFTDGFPPVTMQPIVAGGVPPQGKDFNGILFDITSHTLWVNAGGQYQFDAALSTAMGGYPVGMVLQNNAGTGSYVNALANNTTDFNSSPSSIGVSWLPYGGAAISSATIATTGGNTTLTAVQVASDFVIVTGALTTNATLTFPAAIGKWTVINNTTGAHTLSASVSGGGSRQIAQGSGDTIYSDGTNMRYIVAECDTQAAGDATALIASTLFVQRAVSTVGGYYQDTGTANAYVITTIPATGSYADGQSFRFRALTANTGASTLNAGPGTRTLTREGGAALEANDILPTYVITVTYVAATNSFVINGVVASDFLDSPAFRGTPTAPTATAGDDSTTLATTHFVQVAQTQSTFNQALYMMGLLM